MYNSYLRNLKQLLSHEFKGSVSLSLENNILFISVEFPEGEKYYLTVYRFSEKVDAGITSQVMANSVVRIFKKDILRQFLKH